MFRELLVHVPSNQTARPVIDYSVSMAACYEARLDAVAFGYEPITAELSFDGAAAVAAVMELQRERALEQANAVLATFEAEAKLSGIRYSCRSYTAAPVEAAETLEGLSRLYDLTVVLQPEPGKAVYDNLVPEAVVTSSGGPVLVVPYIHQGPFDASRIAVCWDGSRPAARAVRDAMPLLVRADSVDVLAVNEDPDAVEACSEALVAHLARRGIAASAQRLTGGRANIHNTLLSAATDAGATLLVMGGYGHSRLREFVLGGVTRGMFQSMTIPALMSH